MDYLKQLVMQFHLRKSERKKFSKMQGNSIDTKYSNYTYDIVIHLETKGPVNQIQIHVSKPQISQWFSTRWNNFVFSVSVIPKFRSYEQILSGHSAILNLFADGISNFLFILVEESSIDVTIAVSDCVFYGSLNIPRAWLQ